MSFRIPSSFALVDLSILSDVPEFSLVSDVVDCGFTPAARINAFDQTESKGHLLERSSAQADLDLTVASLRTTGLECRSPNRQTALKRL
jgi:hypothetical protein